MSVPDSEFQSHNPMSNFSLSQVASINFESYPLNQIRALVEAGIEDMEFTFYGHKEEIADWANGG